MSVAPIDRRSELRRRLRSVLNTIDESLSLNRRGMHVKPLSRTRSESPQSKHSSSLVPCVSAWAELRTEQRREELHTQREEAEQLLRTLKLAQERRKLQRHITTEINASSSSSAALTVPLRLGETEVQEQNEKTGLLSTWQTPPSPSPPLPSTIPDVKKEHKEKSTSELVVSDGSVLQVAIVEEESRRRLAERRQAEEESLAKLRALRRKVIKERQEALAQAEAEIEQAESERIAKVMQLEQDVRRSVAEEQERCRITEVELRAMEVHANALATIRSQTGIALPSCILPVRPPPPPAPVPVSVPQTDTASFPSHYGSYSCLSPDTAQNHNHHNSSGIMTVSAVRPTVNGLLSPERDCKVMTAIHSTPQREITTSSASKLAEANQSFSHTPHNSGKEKDGEISPNRLFISPKRDLEKEVPLESPQRLSSSSTINLTTPPSSSSVLSGTLAPEKEDTPHHNSSSATKTPVRKLLSPTLTPHNSLKKNTLEELISMSGAFETLQGRGIVAYVLNSEVNVIPVLLRLSADSRELLLHIGRLKRDINPSKPSTKGLVKGSKQVTFSLDHQKEQNEDHEDEMGCSMRRVEEVHHFDLMHGYILCPFGGIGAESSGEIGGILCGSIARRLLRKLSCTFFARLGGSSYRVFLVSFPTSHHGKGYSTHSSRVINPNGSTLLVLQFRNRQDWATFLMSTGEATRSLNGGVSLTYGRALWILAANLWQRRRSCTHSSLSPIRGESIETKSQTSRMTCVKHFRMVPESLLSFSSNPRRTESVPSQHVVFENHKEHEGVGIPTRRFVLPAQRSNSNIIKKNNITNRISNDVIAPHLERGRRFGLRTTTNNISTSSRPTNTPSTLMRHNY